MNTNQPEFSVIITCYFEEKSIDEFHQRLTTALQGVGRPFEIILVNDGSTDETWARLRAIFDSDSHVSVIANLFRNSGQAAAITAGIELARGRHFVFMDSDLQLDPEDLPRLVESYDQGFDIVSGYRRERRDSFSRRIASHFANMIMRVTAKHSLSDFGCTFKIFNGKLVRAFEFGPRKVFAPTFVFARAQKCAEVAVNHHPRCFGKSGWSLKSLFGYYIDNLVGLSRRPFQLLSLASLGLALLFCLRIALGWVSDISILPEVTGGLLLNAIIISLLMTLSVLSAIGEYVIRVFIIQQGYPQYVVKEVHRKS